MKKLKCQHCGRIWQYSGNQEYYATCSNCKYKVNIKKREIKEE